MSKTCPCRTKHVGHGSSRSLIRQIGSRLPINAGKRIYIRVPGVDSPRIYSGNEFRYEATGEHYVPNEEGLTIASCLHEPHQVLGKVASLFQTEEEREEYQEEVGMVEEVLVDERVVDAGQADTKTNISVLEAELARLRAQIADYALAETDFGRGSAPPIPPPPPPPALQPLGMTTSAASPNSSVHNIATGHAHPPAELITMGGRSDISSMSLQDIGSMKLRKVQGFRSPGGTPLRSTNKTGQIADPNDPVSIISQALRRKFSHSVFKNSPDKENLDCSDTSFSPGFESPTVKLLH